jgi:GABA(A) receptor-associated protein
MFQAPLKSFRETHSLEKRTEVAGRIVSKYVDRVPVIVEKAPGDAPDLAKSKYLVPMGMTVGKFIFELRKHFVGGVSQEKAVFLFVNNILPPTSAQMSYIYQQYKDPDGFLYLVYASENTFG